MSTYITSESTHYTTRFAKTLFCVANQENVPEHTTVLCSERQEMLQNVKMDILFAQV